MNTKSVVLFLLLITTVIVDSKVRAQGLSDNELFGVASPVVANTAEHFPSSGVMFTNRTGTLRGTSQTVKHSFQMVSSSKGTGLSAKVLDPMKPFVTTSVTNGSKELDGPGGLDDHLGPNHQFESTSNGTGEETGEH